MEYTWYLTIIPLYSGIISINEYIFIFKSFIQVTCRNENFSEIERFNFTANKSSPLKLWINIDFISLVFLWSISYIYYILPIILII